MVVIAIDTSQPVGSVALARAGELIGSERFGENASHLVGIGRAIDAMLRNAELTIADVNRLAIVIGPGSFTGLRVGLSFAKGLHAARGIEFVTMNTLELLALTQLEEYDTVCPMIDARRSEVYAAHYGVPESATPYTAAAVLTPPCAQTPAVFLASMSTSPGLFLGSGARLYADQIMSRFPTAKIAADTLDFPSTEYLAAVAHRLDPLSGEDVSTLEPDYLRASEAQRKKLRPIDP